MTEPSAHPVVTDASVLICSRNRPEMLLDVVQSVLAGRSVPREMIIVDQCQSPNLELMAPPTTDGSEVRYLHRPGRGLSLARNIALRAATSDVVVLLDDDMFVDPHWLSRLVAGRPDDRLAVSTGCVLAAPDEGKGEEVPAAALVTTPAAEVYRGRQARDVVPGANVALDRKLCLEIGGFDERLGAGSRFGSADDNDMGFRLLEAGCEVRHVPEAVVFHRSWRSRPELLRLGWEYGRGKGAFYAKHLALRDSYIGRRLAREVLRHLYRALKGAASSRDVARRETIFLAGLVAGFVDWLVRERGPLRPPKP